MNALPLQNLSACLVSKHHKVDYVAPTVTDAFAWQLQGHDQFDTDMLGTFSGESERTLTALECAIYKAEKALKLSNADIGLGSEGSFNPDPYGVVTINQELLACVHREKGLLAVGQASRPVNVRTWTISKTDKDLLEEIISNRPAHQALIMRTIDSTDKYGVGQYGDVYKGLASREEVTAAFGALSKNTRLSNIEVCYDLRAMNCPERQVTIGMAASNLVERLKSVCPKCEAVNFYPETRISGLPCETCQLPTAITKAFIAKCQHCHFESVTPVEQTHAETVNCSYCNP